MFTYIFAIIGFFVAFGIAFLWGMEYLMHQIQEACPEAYKIIQEHKTKEKNTNGN